MNIDNLSEKIQFDVRRLASYKRTQEALPQEPDADYVLIEVKTDKGNETAVRLMRSNDYWLSDIDAGNSSLHYIARDWIDILQRIVNRGWEITSIRLASLGGNVLEDES